MRIIPDGDSFFGDDSGHFFFNFDDTIEIDLDELEKPLLKYGFHGYDVADIKGILEQFLQFKQEAK